jgi:hypothetical protein
MKTFLSAQDEIIDSEIHLLSRKTPRPTSRSGHASIDGDEGLVKEIRALGEGAYGVVEEVSLDPGCLCYTLTNLSTTLTTLRNLLLDAIMVDARFQ